MAKIRLTGATFDASEKTVTHTSFSDVTLAGIQLIVNVTDQIIIYNFADTAKGGTLATDTLTLEYDTTSMSDTDELMVLVEDGVAAQAITAASLPLPSGAATSAKQDTAQTSLDAIKTAVEVLDNVVSGSEAQVDVVGALPAGDNNIGNVDLASAIPAGTNNIGDVDVLTVPADPFGANADAAATAGSTGSIQAKLRLMTSQLDSIKTAVETIDNTVAGSELQVDVLTMPTVTVTATNLDVQSGGADLATTTQAGAIQTAVELIDDAIKADDAAFTPATTKVMMAGFEYDDTATDSVDEGDAGAARMSANRNIYTTIRDAAGNERGVNVNASNQLSVSVDNTVTVGSHAVTNAGTFAVQESGSALTALQLIDDIVATDDTSTHSTGTTKGAVIMAAATPTDTAVNANDIGAVGMTNNREMYVSLRDIAGATAVTGSGNATGALRVELPTNGTGVIATVSALGTGTTGPMKAEDVAHATGDMGIPAWAVSNEANTARAADGDYLPIASDTEGNVRIVGNRDHDAVDAGEPVKIGGKARQTNPTAVADADRVDAMFDDVGRLVTSDTHVRDLVTQQVTTITSSTTETTILTAGAAGVFHDVKSIMIANKSASATLITVRDATAGSAVAYIHCPAGDTRGVVFHTPFKQTTAANNWTAQCGTSVDSVYITVQAVKNV